jgi:hypothetical protein
MRRVLVMSLVGLLLAFGVFYVFSWPSTIESAPASGVTISQVKVGELLHVGMADFTISGDRPITVLTVRLNGASPEIELLAARLFIEESGKSSVGVLRGEGTSVDSLPRAPGYVLHSTDRGSFVVTFRVSSPGRFELDGFTVRYQTGWLTRSVRVGPRIVVEAP